jgi:uncharacterized membrane protein YccC
VIASLVTGILSSVGPGTAWISLNCLVFFLVLGLQIPAPPAEALYHSLLVLAGGLLQCLLLTFFYYARRVLKLHHPDPWFMNGRELGRSARHAMRNFFRGPKEGREAWLYGLRIMITLLAGFALARALHSPRGSWIMMTSALVLKPDLSQTLTRGLGRFAGTLVGGMLATSLVILLQPTHYALSAFMIAAAFAAYLFFYVNYALATVCITSYVVFLLSFEGLPGPEIAYQRVLATFLGGLLALVAHLPSVLRRTASS